jgi:hypothetical protein
MRKRTGLLKRIEKIEQQRSPRRLVLVWRELDETDEAARQRHLAAHPEDSGRRIIIVGWRQAEA